MTNWEFWDSAARWNPELGWCMPDWEHAHGDDDEEVPWPSLSE